ncbi:MAG: hypothetical protein M1823_001766 [Watsoniomyces obsoletus]|nr:MAG: hypothetical protein M1823_001766 [Watsoniomyces obsoletus]
MNGMNGISPPAGLWQEARNSDGRIYYFNTQTKATQWDKPLELMNPAERALSNQPWKEYTAEGGRKYWYNKETKQSSWEMPQVYKDALAQDRPPSRAAPPSQTFVAGGVSSFTPYHNQQQHHAPSNNDRYGGHGYSDVNGARAAMLSSSMTTQQTDPEYSTFEEAEAAFLKLLRRSGVQPEWTWEQTMRAVIKDPQYRALKDPKDRKSAFEKYAVEARLQEKDRAKERLAKLRADFGTMLRSHPEIKHYTRWKTARPMIEGETIFRSTNDDTERRQLFEEHIVGLKKAHGENETTTRKAAMEELVGILNALDLEPYTRWSEAHGLIQSHERFQGDEKFSRLSKVDILTAFENHIKSLERTFNDARQKQKNLRARRERQNRDRFIELLRELRGDGKIKAGTKWKDIHPLIENDERYHGMLGQAGSTPLDLFWDAVEEEERELRGKRNEVLDVLDDKHFEIQSKTTLDEYMAVVEADRRTAQMDRELLQLIFERMHEKTVRRSEDDKHQAERQQRRMVDVLRSKIKHLDPPVGMDDTWDDVRPRIEQFEEYRVLDNDELRRSAFEKVVRRLKEKEEDAQLERTRREKERERERSLAEKASSTHRHGERDRDRTRDRDRRGSRPARRRSARPSRYSRTPEVDAYEAERRKAQAEREKQYRKTSISGMSPIRPRGDRDRDRGRDRERERERERERPDWDRAPASRNASLSHYDRERRAREEERERLYRTRGEPRGSRDELDYGETRSISGGVGGAGAGRRRPRGESDVESVGSRRDTKVRCF